MKNIIPWLFQAAMSVCLIILIGKQNKLTVPQLGNSIMILVSRDSIKT